MTQVNPVETETPEPALFDNWYGFEKYPFHVTPDSAMVFTHRRYEEALSALQYGVSGGKGFIVITGEIGAGKTTLLRHFVNLLGDDVRSAVILNTGLNARDLLCAIAEDLEIPRADTLEGKALSDAIGEVLLKEFQAGRTVAVMIDEAQNLSVEALEAVRMLSNLETENDKLVQIVLFGQPELQDILARPELLQLRTRIAVTYHLMPMDRDETGAYILHRLAQAKPSRPVSFTPRAIAKLHKYSKGSPRLINIIADQALIAGAMNRSERIDVDVIESVIEGFEHLDKPRPRRRPLVLVRLLMMIAVAVTGALILLGRTGSPAVDVPSLPVSPPPAPEIRTSPVSDLLISLGVSPNPAYDQMTVEALASATGLHHKAMMFTPDVAEAIGLPAILMPGNPVVVNPWPSVVKSVKNGVWEIAARDQDVISVPYPASLPLHYLLPSRSYFNRTLRRGDGGDDVLAIQKILGVSQTGYFDRPTLEAVAALQREFKLPHDGVVGEKTMIALYAREKRS